MGAAVLFSGGRDSTLAACLTHEHTEAPVHLLTMENGFGHGPRLAGLRVRELDGALGGESIRHHTLSVRGLAQLIAIRDIENDFRDFHTNLVTLGSALAMIARAAVFALAHELPSVVTGYSGYQRHFPEQSDAAIAWFEDVLTQHGLRLECPIRSYESQRDVKDALLLYDVSGKSLERSTVFADSFSEASDHDVVGYLERKRSIVDAFMARHVRQSHGQS